MVISKARDSAPGDRAAAGRVARRRRATGRRHRSWRIAATGRADYRLRHDGELIQAWAEEYKRVRTEVIVQVAGGGAGVGIAGLIDGTLDLAAASREIRPAETDRARLSRGIEPREVTVAQDALAVYVHTDNPLPWISRQHRVVS